MSLIDFKSGYLQAVQIYNSRNYMSLIDAMPNHIFEPIYNSRNYMSLIDKCWQTANLINLQ